MTKKEYEEYLKSPEWKRTTQIARVLAGYRCQVCNGKERSLHSHHRSYDHVGAAQEILDLVVLCGSCHTLFHNITPTPPITRRQKKNKTRDILDRPGEGLVLPCPGEFIQAAHKGRMKTDNIVLHLYLTKEEMQQIWEELKEIIEAYPGDTEVRIVMGEEVYKLEKGQRLLVDSDSFLLLEELFEPLSEWSMAKLLMTDTKVEKVYLPAMHKECQRQQPDCEGCGGKILDDTRACWVQTAGPGEEMVTIRSFCPECYEKENLNA